MAPGRHRRGHGVLRLIRCCVPIVALLTIIIPCCTLTILFWDRAGLSFYFWILLLALTKKDYVAPGVYHGADTLETRKVRFLFNTGAVLIGW